MADKSVAVAFGGGGARGIAHIHIIEVLDELGITPVAVSGTSIGAIMSSAMAAGMSGVDIREFMMESIGRPTNVASRLWKARRPTWKSVITEGVTLGQFNVERIIDAFMPEELPHSFDELRIPTQLLATDFYGHSEVIMNDGNLRSAIAASAALPAIFKPVHRDGRFLIDGGIFNPLPFDVLEGLADIIIAVDVAGFPTGDASQRPSTTDAAFGASQLMMQSIIAEKVEKTPPDIFLVPDVHDFRVLDFMNADDVLKQSAGIRDVLKSELDRVLS
ncbi:MAG: patatin-like phospholipase family protein [Lentilitoribacter sp.]